MRASDICGWGGLRRSRSADSGHLSAADLSTLTPSRLLAQRDRSSLRKEGKGFAVVDMRSCYPPTPIMAAAGLAGMVRHMQCRMYLPASTRAPRWGVPAWLGSCYATLRPYHLSAPRRVPSRGGFLRSACLALPCLVPFRHHTRRASLMIDTMSVLSWSSVSVAS